MSRKIILNLAASLDGYIADEAGGYGWIAGHGNHDLDTSPKWEHAEFLQHVDMVVMGKACYDQGFAKDFSDKTVYVATTKEQTDYDNIRFVRNDICLLLETARENEGKDIYLFGGGKLCDSIIKANMVDEFIIGIIPIMLGKGIPLFLGGSPTIPLKLKACYIDDGVVILRYQKDGLHRCKTTGF